MQRISLAKFMLILVLLISFCSLSPVFADEDSEGGFAPLSPEFLEWQKEQAQQQERESSGIPVLHSSASTEHPNGYIPIPVDFSHLADNPPK